MMTVTIVAGKMLKKEDLRGSLSSLLERFCDEPVIKTDLSRDAFEQTEVVEPRPVQGHTHATAAALRTSATSFARAYALHMGVRIFSLEMSKSDQRKGIPGTRQWYWAKDTHTQNRNMTRYADDVEWICDVDYYINMVLLLSSRAKPTLLYTVVPEEAVGVHDDTTFYFNEDGSLTTIVAGGGTYHHHLWDYATDSLIVRGTNRFGFTNSVTTYAVERKQVGYSRQIILLSPIKRFTGIMSHLALYLLEGKQLTRFNPVVKARDGSSFIRFLVHTKKCTKVTTARPSTLACATVDAVDDAHVATMARLSTVNIMLPTVVSWLPPHSRGAAAVLTEYYRFNIPAKHPIVYPVEMGVRAYQYEPKKFDQEARPKLSAFMSPLVHGAFVPVQNEASERRAIEGRLTALKAPEPKPMAFRDQCINEFVDLVLQGKTLYPVDIDVVLEKQTRPAQVLSLMKACLSGDRSPAEWLKLFLKGEAYPDVKDPRIISMINDSDKLAWSMFSLAMSNHLKQFAWYGPGKTPKQLANRVTTICQSAAEFVNISDYFRMDGTIKRTLRQVDRTLYMRAFPEFRSELNELFKRNTDNNVSFQSGVSGEQGSAHASGHPGTSVDQTTRAAFCSYFAYRNVRDQHGRPLDPQTAFDSLGIHFGDDGLDADLPTSNHVWAAKNLGLILEASTIQRGERGVNFLARYYSPGVWEGAVDSMCDIKRQLAKFHTTGNLPSSVRAEAKLVEKSMSYVSSDANTPIIGAFCRRVLTVSTFRPTKLLGVGSWWSKFEDSEQYPNQNTDNWMEADFDVQFPEFDRVMFEKFMVTAFSVDQLLKPPLCCEIKPATPAKVDIVIDGDVLTSKPDNSGPSTPSTVDSAETAASNSSLDSNRPKRTRRRKKPETKGVSEAQSVQSTETPPKGKGLKYKAKQAQDPLPQP